jgi:hypothetical protein
MFNLFNIYGRSWKWKDVRKKHLKIQPSCQACGRLDNLEVHHIEPFQLKPEKELDPNNLITLCSKSCHLTFGHLMDYKSWNTDVVNDSRLYLQKLNNRPYNENYTQSSLGYKSFYESFLNWWNN